MANKEFTADSPYVCSWTIESCCDALNSADDAIAQQAVNTAAEVLYALSGRQFGLCSLTIRPCRIGCCSPCNGGAAPFWDPGWGAYPWVPVLTGGQWTNVACRGCGDTCGCTIVNEIILPGPVGSVTEVKIDGDVADITKFRVDNRRYLVRMDGSRWPVCQDMNLPDTETGTYSITYTRGKPLPAAGGSALGTLACELVKACTGDKTCALPDRVTSISRQGVTFQMPDPYDFIGKGRTGLYSVDLWLQAFNPKMRVREAGIYSPDFPEGRMTTWQG